MTDSSTVGRDSSLLNVLVGLAYFAALLYSYRSFTATNFAYAGFELFERSNLVVACSAVLAIIPLGFYRGVRTVSSVVTVFVYSLLFLPSLVMLSLGADLPDTTSLLVQGLLGGGMCLLFLAASLVVRLPLAPALTDRMPVVAFMATVAITLWVTFVYRGNLAIVSFADVYELRFANVDLGGGVATRYLSSWLTTVFAPLTIAWGLRGRAPAYVLAGVMGFGIMYMATGAKQSILLPLIVSAVFVALSGGRRRWFLPLVLGTLAIVCVSLGSVQPDTPAFMVASLILMRTVFNGGMVTVKYLEFFRVHPTTELTHVNLIRALFGHYPFGEWSVGQAVGRYFWAPDMNANAHFWATDGIAAFGLLGLPFATVVCAGVFVAINATTRRWHFPYAAASFVPFVASLLNTSVFQSVLSGGALLLMLAFFCTCQPQVKRSGSGR